MRWLKNLLGFGEDPKTAAARKRMAQDEHDPRRRFVFGVLAMSYEVDPGYLPEHGRTAIREWYGIADRDDLLRRIHDYVEGYNDSRGYDALLGTFLARAGFAAEMLGEEESWNLAFAAARTIQPAYASWADYGRGYLAGHLAYRETQGDDSEKLARSRNNITERIAKHERELWTRTPFDTQL